MYIHISKYICVGCSNVEMIEMKFELGVKGKNIKRVSHLIQPELKVLKVNDK